MFVAYLQLRHTQLLRCVDADRAHVREAAALGPHDDFVLAGTQSDKVGLAPKLVPPSMLYAAPSATVRTVMRASASPAQLGATTSTPVSTGRPSCGTSIVSRRRHPISLAVNTTYRPPDKPVNSGLV